MKALLHALGRIRTRLVIVNLGVLLVPIAGLEFARLYERQLLDGLERDMRNQAALVGETLVADRERGVSIDDPRHEATLRSAARATHTRIRILDTSGHLVADSHGWGPPEGLEPPPPTIVPGRIGQSLESRGGRWTAAGQGWPAVCDRSEVRAALAGRVGTMTRVVRSPPEVQLFVAEPIPGGGGVVYVNRSTRQVLVGLYRIRAGLIRVLVVAIAFTALVTLALAWTISRPLGKLANAAHRVAAGQRDVAVPIVGTGEIRDLAESFARMKDRLEERLRHTENFVADVAHELKSPLTSIRGAAELLSEGAADDTVARARFLSNIAHDVERLDRLVSRLLVLSRIEASTEVAAPVELVPLTKRLAERAETPDVAVSVQIDSRAPFVWGRAADLEVALSNLADNAVRFSPPGAKVELVIDDVPPCVRIRIIDHGPGVPADHRDRIFDRFFTTDADRNGTGLGLAIARSVALAHSGTITLTETPGGGATLELRIPSPKR